MKYWTIAFLKSIFLKNQHIHCNCFSDLSKIEIWILVSKLFIKISTRFFERTVCIKDDYNIHSFSDIKNYKVLKCQGLKRSFNQIPKRTLCFLSTQIELIIVNTFYLLLLKVSILSLESLLSLLMLFVSCFSWLGQCCSLVLALMLTSFWPFKALLLLFIFFFDWNWVFEIAKWFELLYEGNSK